MSKHQRRGRPPGARTKGGVKPCMVCGKEYRNLGALYNHLMKKHAKAADAIRKMNT